MLFKLCLVISIFNVVYSQPFGNNGGGQIPSSGNMGMPNFGNFFGFLPPRVLKKMSQKMNSDWAKYIPNFARQQIVDAGARVPQDVSPPQDAMGGSIPDFQSSQDIMVPPAHGAMENWGI